MEDNINSLIEYYTDKKLKGLDLSDIRKELALRNYDPHIIKYIINEIDNRVLREELGRSGKIRRREVKIIGLALVTGGIALTLATLFGIIDLKGYYILSYGPLLAGAFMILASRRMHSNPGRINGRKRYFG
jgi:hypothetical protein